MRVVLGTLGLGLLAGGMFWLWIEHQALADRTASSARVAILEDQLRTLSQRLAQLEQRPPPPPPPPPAAPVDLRPLEARIAAVERRTPAASPPSSTDIALAERIAQLDLRIAQAEGGRSGNAARAEILARWQRAAYALQAGLPLGPLPGAPPALARFATARPPTEAALRLGFAEAARRAEAASHDDSTAEGVAARVWRRMQGLVTVRNGPTVLLGSPAAVTLGRAEALLQQGDLAGAVDALDALDAAAAGGIAEWRASASEVLAARAALAGLQPE